jgi:hypothetical protein
VVVSWCCSLLEGAALVAFRPIQLLVVGAVLGRRQCGFRSGRLPHGGCARILFFDGLAFICILSSRVNAPSSVSLVPSILGERTGMGASLTMDGMHCEEVYLCLMVMKAFFRWCGVFLLRFRSSSISKCFGGRRFKCLQAMRRVVFCCVPVVWVIFVAVFVSIL